MLLWRALVAVSLLASCWATDCSDIKIKCKEIKEKDCPPSVGLFVPKGGLCGQCNACWKFVGEDECCAPSDDPPTRVCLRHLVCDERTKRCVPRTKEQCDKYQCEYFSCD